VAGACGGVDGTLGTTSHGEERWPAPWTRPSCPEPVRDTDADGVQDAEDLCPSLADPTQPDRDSDGCGDACDALPDEPTLRC
jgi:hypothetical protein